MANWNNPLITTQYDVFVAEAKARDEDAATLQHTPGTNLPVNTIRYNRTTNKFEQWTGAAWTALTLSVAGGGTGASDAGTARANLGIGSMGVQNSNAVAVTGGTVTGLSAFSVATTIQVGADNTYDLATFAAQMRKGYFKSAFVLPVGVDKYATS